MPSKREYRQAAALYTFSRARDAHTASRSSWAEQRRHRVTKQVRRQQRAAAGETEQQTEQQQPQQLKGAKPR